MADIRSLIGRDREMVRKAAMREEQLDKAAAKAEGAEGTTAAPPTQQSVGGGSGPSAGMAGGSESSAAALKQAVAEAAGAAGAKGAGASAASSDAGSGGGGADGAPAAPAAISAAAAPKPPMPSGKAAPKPPMPGGRAAAAPAASSSGEFLELGSDTTAPVEARRARKAATAAGAAAAAGGAGGEGPTTTGAAIEAGIELYERGDYANALTLFEAALELPGSAVARFASSPREYRCASDGEVQSALYNAACCHAQMGDAKRGLETLEGAMENGFEEFDAALADEDLQPLGRDAIEQLIAKFNNPVGKLFRKTKSGKGGPQWLKLGF
eukprot:PRCOL_00004687-RA